MRGKTGAILSLSCMFLSTGAKTVWGLQWRTRVIVKHSVSWVITFTKVEFNLNNPAQPCQLIINHNFLIIFNQHIQLLTLSYNVLRPSWLVSWSCMVIGASRGGVSGVQGTSEKNSSWCITNTTSQLHLNPTLRRESPLYNPKTNVTWSKCPERTSRGGRENHWKGSHQSN